MSLDIRIKCGWADHPKTERLARRCGPDAPRCLVRLWCWAREHRPDGVLAGMDGEAVEIAAGWRGEPGAFAPALVELGWIDGMDTVLVLHEWEEHESWSASSAERSESARLAGIASGVSRRTKADAKRTECERTSNGPFSSVHDPLNGMRTESNGKRTPSPSPSPSPKEKNPERDSRGPAGADHGPGRKDSLVGYKEAVQAWYEAFARVTGSKPGRWSEREGANLKGLLRSLGGDEVRRRIGLFEAHHKAGSFGADSFVWDSFVRHIDRWAVDPAGAPAQRAPEISREVLALRAAQKGGPA